jgi:hypothetical protein
LLQTQCQRGCLKIIPTADLTGPPPTFRLTIVNL